jgi:glycosyltransferase involved in cell wall biosynthesis
MLTRWILKMPEKFTVHSQHDYETLLHFRPDASIQHMAMAPHPRQHIRAEEKNRAREILKLDLSCPVFLYFGFIRKYKGLDVLLKALKDTLDKIHVHLLIVGEFWEAKEKYDALIQELNIRHALTLVEGYVPNSDLGVYFGAADCVVLPYRSATQSGVPQLAFSMGKPVIVTDVGGLSENIKNERMGRVVPPENSDALAEAMIELAENPLMLPEASIKDLDRKFDAAWQETIDGIEHVLLEF